MAKRENENSKAYRVSIGQLKARQTYEALLWFDKSTDPEEICLIRERSIPWQQNLL